MTCAPGPGAFLCHLGIVLCCLLLAPAFIIWYQYDPTIARENGPMENFEAGCLTAGVLILLLRLRKLNSRSERILCAGFTVFYGTFLVLEVDVRDTEWRTLIKLMNGRIRDLWLGSLWLAVLVLFVRDARGIWPLFVQWLSSSSGKVMLCAGALWLASAGVDKALIIPKDLFVEEVFEVPATALMLFSAFLQNRGCAERARN